jgi:hypothetical protein
MLDAGLAHQTEMLPKRDDSQRADVRDLAPARR